LRIYIMDEILPLGSWHWRDDSGKLVMSGIKERVMRLSDEKYKQARDDNRAAEGRPPRWVGTATELAAYCVPNKSDKSFRARFAATNAIFDTIPDGRKQALGKKTPQEKLEARNARSAVSRTPKSTAILTAAVLNSRKLGKRHTNYN
jgi:hypothetical protein